MSHFLLIYNRSTGKLVRRQEYTSGQEALSARFDAEIEYDGHNEIEVVAIDAASEEELRRTHGRYFLELDELVARMG